jgi:hypothetical protein
MRLFLIALAAVFGCGGQIRGADPEPPSGMEIRPDARIQERLKQACQVFCDKGTSYSEYLKAMGRLHEFTRDEKAFFQQIFYFYWRDDLAIVDREAQRHFATWTTHFFRIGEHTILETVAPYLEARDPDLRSLPRSFLSQFVKDDDFYSSYLAARKENPPPGFIENLFRYYHESYLSVAGGALMAGMEPGRNLNWAEHVINDAIWKKRHGFKDAFAEAKPAAIAELEKLSQQRLWPMRYYAAMTLSLHREFRTEPMVERLKGDDHEMVRKAISPPQVQPPQAIPGVVVSIP